jgi:hypothetical protein
MNDLNRVNNFRDLLRQVFNFLKALLHLFLSVISDMVKCEYCALVNACALILHVDMNACYIFNTCEFVHTSQPCDI